MDYLQINELYHHGIKGQKWGVRNYQNEDGSLTAEGRQQYGIGDARSVAQQTNRSIVRNAEQNKSETRHGTLKTLRAIRKNPGTKEVIRGAAMVGLGARGLQKTIPRAINRFKNYGIPQPGSMNLVKIPGGTPNQKVAAAGAVAIAGALAIYGAVKIGKGIKNGVNYSQNKKRK